MRKRILLLILFFPFYAYAQRDCRAIIQKAEAAIHGQEYTLALTKLRAYKICDPSGASKADSMIANVVVLIKNQRDSAVIARNEAEKQTKIARMEKARAETARKNAERQAYLAQLSAMSSNVALLKNENATLAFRLACLAYERNPSVENATILHSIISDTTIGMYFRHITTTYDSFGYDDNTNTWYGAVESQGIYEYDMNGRQTRTAHYQAFRTSFISVSCNARYTAAVLENELSLYRHADFSEKCIPWAGPQTRQLRWSRDGAYIQILDSANVLHVFDTLLNEVHKGTYKRVVAFDVSRGMNTIAVSDGDRIVLCNPAGSIAIDTIAEPRVNYLAFSGNGEKLYTSNGKEGDYKIKQWRAGEKEPLILEGHTGKIQSINFIADPAGKDIILSTSEDGLSLLWSEEGRIIRAIKTRAEQDEDFMTNVVLSNKGEKAVIRTGNGLTFWNLQTNPLGVAAKYHDNKTVTDITKDLMIISAGNNTYHIVTRDSIRKISLPAPDVLYNILAVDGKDRFLVIGEKSISVLNVQSGESKKLIDLERRYFRTSVNADGNILCWRDDSLFHFNKDGVLRHARKFPHYIHSPCMPPGTEDILYVYGREAYLIDISTGKQKGRWRLGDLNETDIMGVTASPSREYIAVWGVNNAFLLDSAWHRLKTYDYPYVARVKFSENEDSLYFFEVGVEARYTLKGLKKSRDICDLTIADKLRYSVPGTVKDIVNKGDWTEFEACISYFSTDYYTSRNEMNIEQLRYLESHSRRFFQKNKGYYSMLDTRINHIRSAASHARTYEYSALEKVLLKIAANLTKEQQTLALLYK